MTEKTVSQLDRAGYFVGHVVADESPLEPGVYLIPANAVDAKPPKVPEGKRAKFNGSTFALEDIPAISPEESTELSAKQMAKAQRAAAFQAEADPLYFKAQRGEATLEEWKAKIAEIKTRFPDPL